jgi:formate dehydrogenase
MTTREVATYCRICEPQCGLIATVEDGKLVKVRGDREHVHSQGFQCQKSAAAVEILYDPDRVTQPLKRVGGPGEFEPVSWDEAMADIAARLRALRQKHGPAAFATFLGNPPAAGYATAMWLGGFQAALGVKWRYGVNADDAAARMAANALLYGSVATILKPDLWRTNFAILIGTNPLVSHGSMVTEARIRDALDGVIARGGRVLVIDPRRTKTAERYEHLPIRPGQDAFLLLGMIGTILAEGLVDRAFAARWTTGTEALAAAVERFPIDRCAAACGIDAEAISRLARDFATTQGALVYGRTGTCQQRFGTLVNFLQDVVMVLTGKIDREGGMLFGWGPIDFEAFAARAGLDTFGRDRTRVNNHPDVFGMHPSTSLRPDILTPGIDQVRALMIIGANPVLTSAGGGPALEDALSRLELSFALDLYVNESNKHCDYVLPVRHFYERDDFPLAPAGNMLRPALWATPAVVEPRGEAREEWRILDDLTRRLGLGGAYLLRPMRVLARAGIRPSPRWVLDALIRTSSAGDMFGLRRGGLTLKRLLAEHPHGKQLRGDLPTGQLAEKLRTPSKRIDLAPSEIRDELTRLDGYADDPRYSLRLIGMRDLRSQNTWMHNTLRLMPDTRRHSARVHPVDAAAAALRDGEEAEISSASGTVRIPVTVTDEVSPGTIAIPHGWGHAGGWARANAARGVNSNLLASGELDDIERLAGMSVFNGIPVTLSRPGV